MIKYLVLAVLAGVTGYMAYRAGGFHAVDPFYGMDRRSHLQDFFMLFGAVLIIVPLSLCFGLFANCHYLCWGAPIMIIGTKIKNTIGWPSLHLTANPATCKDCGNCDQHCPMKLPVAAMVKRGNMQNAECIMCGNCIDRCPTGAIGYAFGVPNRTRS